MIHLGDRLSDLVDGRLLGGEMDRAHSHLSTCRRCTAEERSLREFRDRLTSCAAPVMPEGFEQRLLAIPRLQAVVGPCPAELLLSGTRQAVGPGGRWDVRRPRGRVDRARGVHWSTRRRLGAMMLGTVSLVGAGVVCLRAVASTVPSSPVVPVTTGFVSTRTVPALVPALGYDVTARFVPVP
jgi:anti-sigma factor RsiW